MKTSRNLSRSISTTLRFQDPLLPALFWFCCLYGLLVEVGTMYELLTLLLDSLVEDTEVLELFELVGAELKLVSELVALSSSTG